MITPFGDALADVSTRVEGVLAISLIGLDGIAIETIKNREDVPVESLGAELGSFVKSIRMSNTDLKLGNVEQFSLVSEQFVTFLSEVTGEYFVAAELSIRGYLATITLRNSRGIDIIATNSDASRSVTIQVKTNKKASPKWMLNKKAES